MKRFFLTSSVLALTSIASMAQVSINGSVKDVNGVPIEGAHVYLEDTYLVTYTNTEGEFTVSNVLSGEQILRITHLGHESIYDTLNVSNSDINRSLVMYNDNYQIHEVAVTGTRADHKTPIAYTNIDKQELEERNLGQDLPVLLNQTPSLVSNSDAGVGVGYTNMWIRGSDATRINVTLNGIPVNDAESQGVFWVNLPDLTSSTDNIQIQRGVGTSTNGAGAFGASINLQTGTYRAKPYAETNHSYGSFNTRKHNVLFGTGLINDKYTVEGRVSKILSDGFIDRASSDLTSLYLSTAYYGKKSSLKFNIIHGQEETYQAWYGVTPEQLGQNRSFNIYDYENQVDNYRQTYYQLIYNNKLSSHWNLNAALFYTRGKGYFEEYKGEAFNQESKQEFADYGLENVIIGNDTITETDLVRRRWLDNHYYGLTFSAVYERSRLQVTIGGAATEYRGDHFGEIIWAEYASNSTLGDNYYFNDALKRDINAFVKTNYKLNQKLNAYVDLQVRNVDYTYFGFDEDLNNVNQNEALTFFNPKVGLSYALKNNTQLYASFGRASKEPNRNDFTESSPTSRPEHEVLNDFEAGIRTSSNKFSFAANAYYMLYENQLVLNGQINDVGAFTRVNVDNSFRRGIELEGAYRFNNKLQWAGNVTLSQNKIEEFVEYIDDFDNGGQATEEFENTTISFSPSVIAASQITITPIENFNISVFSKYVGEQFLDNTESEAGTLEAYFVNDLKLDYTFKLKGIKSIGVSLLVNNILDEEYESNGYTYNFISGGVKDSFVGLYPQAGTNFLAGLSLKF